VHRWMDLSQVPPGFGPSVVTFGNFDGVHRGHQAVLRRMVADARAEGARAVAVTFSPHPLAVHAPERAPELLLGIADRFELLAETGLDAVLLLEYSLDFARQSPEEFVQRYLAGGLNARTVVVGHDVRFGWQNAGDLSTMIELGRKYGFEVDVIADISEVDEDAPIGSVGSPGPADRRWSSTWARELLLAGEVAHAAAILGRPHRMRGVVVHGDARGRELGFPTANLGPDAAGLIPADGVYAGWMRRVDLPTGLPDAHLPVAISVGSNPTFDGHQRRVEAHVLDRDDLDLYDEHVVIEFAERLRPTLRFDSVGALVDQMRADVEQCHDRLGVARPGLGAADAD